MWSWFTKQRSPRPCAGEWQEEEEEEEEEEEVLWETECTP